MSRARPEISFAGLVAFAIIAIFTSAAHQSHASVVSDNPSAWKLTLDDEFSGTSLDTTKWNYRYLGVRNDAVNTQSAVSVSNGQLAITTSTSGGTNYTGMIGTQNLFSQATGYFEASIDFKSSPGEWGAFWLQSPTNGTPLNNPAVAGTEIDVTENRATDSTGTNVSNTWEGALHWNGYGSNAQSASSTVPSLGLQSGMHLYGILWTSTQYTFYVDNRVVWTTTQGVSHTPEYMILSSEVENASWAGSIPAAGYGSAQTSTTSMNVDYVHVYSTPEPSAAALLLTSLAFLLCHRQRAKTLWTQDRSDAAAKYKSRDARFQVRFLIWPQ